MSLNKLLPLYIQIANHIRNQIISGELAPDSKLPTQREMAEQFATTLMTVRQALEVLEEENLLRTEHGIGSFVVDPGMKEENLHVMSFSKEMSQRARRVTTRQVSLEVDVNNQKACQALGLADDVPLVKIVRQRLLNESPIVYQCSYLPPMFRDIGFNYDTQRSLYEQMREYGQAVSMTREILQPVCLTSEQSAWLLTKTGEPALLSLRVGLNREDVPLVFDEAFLHGKYFVISTQRLGHHRTYQFNLLDDVSANLLDLLEKID